MITEKIYFQKSYQVGEFLYEHYGMLGVLEPNETVDEAYDKARAETFRQHQRNNPQIKWNEGTPVAEIKKDTTVYAIDIENEKKYEEFKEKLSAFEFKEDAELYRSTSEFKYSIDAANIINKKPSKK